MISRSSQEIIVEIKTIRSLAREPEFLLQYGNQLTTRFQFVTSRNLIASISYGFSVSVQLLMYSVSFWFGGWLVYNNTCAFPDIFFHAVFQRIPYLLFSSPFLLLLLAFLKYCYNGRYWLVAVIRLRTF